MPAKSTDWKKELQPLLNQYRGKRHPLDYHNPYELIVMVVLSAQDSDRNINKLAPALFNAFPDMKALSMATVDAVIPFVNKVRGHYKKTGWLLEIARKIQDDKNIPRRLEELTSLPGIGRKSANVILREMGEPAVGIIVDLHVVRVAPRLDIAQGTDPKKLEKQLMDAMDAKDWGEVGMAISFLGRETCRPSNPKCPECVMKKVCVFTKTLTSIPPKTAGKKKVTSKIKAKAKKKK